MTAAYAPLRELLAGAGYDFVEPPILFPARIFVELAGEDLRRRLFLANAADGTEMALRPDYTIPVCLHHIANGAAKRRAGYAYLGPIFRQRASESGEFLQAGVESLGRSDRAAADADMLKLALEAVTLLGVKKTTVRIGDSALFAAVLAALDLGEPWRRRLARAFGDTPRLKTLIGKLSGGDQPAPSHEGFLAALDGADHDAAHRVVEDLLALAGIRTVGGRTAGEIANRFLEKASLAAGARNGARAAKVLDRFLALAGAPDKTAAALRTLARTEELDLGKAVEGFEARVENFRKHGIDPGRLIFAADFGRRLDYYTGFVFEVHDSSRSDGRPLVGGGRYDRLVALLGAPGTVPAVGFSIWLDRFNVA